MPNVLEQLVQHREYLDDAAPPLTLGEVTDRASSSVQQVPIRDRTHTLVQRPWWASGWAVAAGTAAAVLLIGGGALLAISPTDPTAPADDPPVVSAPEVTVVPESTMAPVTTLASAAPSTQGAPESWTRIDAGDMVGGSIATGPMGMVALITNTSDEGTAWFSENGETWQALSVPLGKDVAFGDPGFVICCNGDTADDGYGLVAATSSFSPNGVTWFTTPLDPTDASQPPEPGTYEFSGGSIAYGNGKFVIVGELVEIDAQPTEEPGRSLVVWYSDDGRTWTPVSQDEVSDPDLDPGHSTVTFVADRFAVTGSNGVWHSADGETWTQVTQVPDPNVPSGGVHGDGGYVATGYADIAPDDYRAVIWHSADGLSWEIVVVNPDWGDIADVMYGDRGYLAVGWSGSQGGAAAVWHSTDGVTWTGPIHYPGFGSADMLHAGTYIDGRYFIFGETYPTRETPSTQGWVFISDL